MVLPPRTTNGPITNCCAAVSWTPTPSLPIRRLAEIGIPDKWVRQLLAVCSWTHGWRATTPVLEIAMWVVEAMRIDCGGFEAPYDSLDRCRDVVGDDCVFGILDNGGEKFVRIGMRKSNNTACELATDVLPTGLPLLLVSI